MQAAFALGAAGVEVDILYDRHHERFYVSHDHPYQTFDSQPLTLAALQADPRVRVILTDNNRFAAAACAGEAEPH